MWLSEFTWFIALVQKSKLWGEVGMAAPQSTQTRIAGITNLQLISRYLSISQRPHEDVGMSTCNLLSIIPAIVVCVLCGAVIPTSLHDLIS